MAVVSDDGLGVPSGLVDRVFVPFERGHGRALDVDPVGLGLSVSRSLARLMGGELAYRREGDWTRFVLTLPITSEKADEATGAWASVAGE